MVHLTIDGKPIEVPAGTTVLKAAQMADIQIPTLCDHPAIKPFGSCRLCVVEIEGFRTLQASCTLPASEGMVVRTDTPKLHASRKFILSMLFSERNHFCMYCQKTDGDCELQNCAYGEDMDHWPMQPNWNPYPLDSSHPYYVVDHNRCILCRRCVRACGELVGNFTLGIENRGYNSMLVYDSGVPAGESSCVKCGTCVQVCPTGALIDRQSAYIAKNSTSEHVHSVCVGCSVGCGIDMVVSENRLVHIDGDWDAPVNGGILCEEGRYLPLKDGQERITTPLIRQNGKLVPASWEKAFNTLALQLKGDNQSLAAIVSTRLPAEALFAFKRLFHDGLKSKVVTSVEEDAITAFQTAVPAEAKRLNGSLESLKESDCVVVVGADLAERHQVAGFFVNRNLYKGAKLIVIDTAENGMDAFADYSLKLAKGKEGDLFLGLASAVKGLGLDKSEGAAVDYSLDKASKATGISSETIVAAAREIASAQKPVFVFGKGFTAGVATKTVKALLALADVTGAAALVSLKGKANSSAARSYGLDKPFEADGYQAAYVALGDDAPSSRLMKKLEGVPFLAVQASYASALTEKADIVLPAATWIEQAGHYLNLDGRLQEARPALAAPAGIRSNVEVLEELAECLNVKVGGSWEKALA